MAVCAFELYQSFWLGSNGVRARAAPNHRLGVTEVDSGYAFIRHVRTDGCGCITLFHPFG
jgi:hypothetical protein